VRVAHAFACLAVLLGSGVARADPGETSTGYINKVQYHLEIDDCAPDPGVPKDERLRRGAEYYNRGEVLYLQGDYIGAIDELVRSYCEVPFYTLLKDIGQAYERKLEYGMAVAYFERFVLAVPADAKRRDACSPDPQEDKRNVFARISVLATLPSKIRVQTTPPDANIHIDLDQHPISAGHTGDELLVPQGTYQLVVEREGYRTKRLPIEAEIGQPYTYDVQLEPIRGRLKIRVIPGDARLFLDKRQVGSGIYATELPAGRYTIQAEAPDHVTVSRELEILPDKDTNLSFELPPEPEFGRKQLLGYGAIGGAIAAGLIAGGAQSDGTFTSLAALGGIGAGFFGVYYGTPRDLALGTSSLTVTSSLIGGVGGGALAGTVGLDTEVGAALVGGGLLVGAIGGYVVADRTHPSPGDAAVINSGALWGTVAGGLFTISFDPGPQISAGLVLSGLGMGTLGGVLLQRYFTVSRGRAALIDASGMVGIVLGLAAENLVEQSMTNPTPSQERTANYALGGLAGGLILGGVLTRTLDEPKLATLTPAFGTAKAANGDTTTTIGIGGAF
jgi:PEGA domain